MRINRLFAHYLLSFHARWTVSVCRAGVVSRRMAAPATSSVSGYSM